MRDLGTQIDIHLPVARTPSKLIDMLLSKGITQSIITAQLSITEGDVKDVESVRKTLCPAGKTADVIISGIGKPLLSLPTLLFIIRHQRYQYFASKNTPPTNISMPGTYSMRTNTICRIASSNILSALALLQPSPKPLVLVLSTTGISSGPRDVPLAFLPFYRTLLINPHKDKSAMEKTLTDAFIANAHSPDTETETWIRGFVIVRASLLTNGPALGKAQVRVGSEAKPAVGYTISREDVGQWVFENVIRDESRDRWAGEKVSLTY